MHSLLFQHVIGAYGHSFIILVYYGFIQTITKLTCHIGSYDLIKLSSVELVIYLPEGPSKPVLYFGVFRQHDLDVLWLCWFRLRQEGYKAPNPFLTQVHLRCQYYSRVHPLTSCNKGQI